MPKIIPVIGGRFTCPHCGESWVGTWHGPQEDMTCPWCKKSLSREIPDPKSYHEN